MKITKSFIDFLKKIFAYNDQADEQYGIAPIKSYKGYISVDFSVLDIVHSYYSPKEKEIDLRIKTKHTK